MKASGSLAVAALLAVAGLGGWTVHHAPSALKPIYASHQ
jgi:hypothetical protein